MLAVILKILSILGSILLILLCIIVCVLLLVLFMPIVYRVDAKRSDTETKVNLRVRWLFGFLRAKYLYPEPGKMIVKVLWFTVFKNRTDSNEESKNNPTDMESTSTESTGTETADAETTEAKTTEAKTTDSKTTDAENTDPSAVSQNTDSNTENAGNEDEGNKKGVFDKLFVKYEKIKYTINKIYDKIKHIWENITFYKKLLQDEQTKLLFSHVVKRLGKILRHIRPRKLKADVVFGTGSPDTTGYAYGIYGMISPQLGKTVSITPDFTQNILEGSVNVAGHITFFTLLVNFLAVLLDKRLRILIRRLKNH